MDATAKIGRNLVSKHHIQPGYGDAQPNPSRETKLSGANGDRKTFIFPVQLTTGSDDHTYIHVHQSPCTDAKQNKDKGHDEPGYSSILLHWV